MYEVKNSKICNFWTFWPVIQLIKELSTKISRSAVFASCIAGILKHDNWKNCVMENLYLYCHDRSESLFYSRTFLYLYEPPNTPKDLCHCHTKRLGPHQLGKTSNHCMDNSFNYTLSY